MDADERGCGRVRATRLSLVTYVWAITVAGLLLALVIQNVKLRGEVYRLEARLLSLEAERVLLPVGAQLSNAGVPLDVDRAMQMNSSTTLR